MSDLRRKWKTFKTRPWASLASYVSGQGSRSVKKAFAAYARWQLARRSVVDFVNFRPPHALRPNWSDLWFLYQMVRKRRPRSVIEFGSGCSTVVIAQALKHNREASGVEGSLLSVDAEAYWAEVTRSTIPSSLDPICDVIHAPLEIVERHDTSVFIHELGPIAMPDLVYLDGPALTPEVKVAADLIDWEADLPANFFLIVDGRSTNARFLHQHFRRRHRFRYRPFFSNFTLEFIDEGNLSS